MTYQVFDQTNDATIAANCPTLERAVEQAQFARKQNGQIKIEIWSGKPEYGIYDEHGKLIGNQR